MFDRDKYSLSEIYVNNILLEAKDVIKSDNPKELLAKSITGSSLYVSNEKLKEEADRISESIINQILEIQKQNNKRLFGDRDLMSLVNSLLMMSGTQQYVNGINNDPSKVNLGLYNRALPVLLHDYKDSLDKSETLLNDTHFSNFFQKGIPKWMDIVHSVEGKVKHKPQEVKQTKTQEALFENEEVAVYLGNDVDNPVNGVRRCKKFGKGSTLCISGSNAAYYYHYYRWVHKLTTYFCFLKKRKHYMLVDVKDDGNLQYNPIFDKNRKPHNIEYPITKEQLIKLYPELKEPLNQDIFIVVPIKNKELEFYKKIYNIDSILSLDNPEDRLEFSSFMEIYENEWQEIPKEEWNKLLENAIYVSIDNDIPDEVLEQSPRLYKQYTINLKRRVEEFVSDFDYQNMEYERISSRGWRMLKDVDLDKFSDEFLLFNGDFLSDMLRGKDFLKRIKELKNNFIKNTEDDQIKNLNKNIEALKNNISLNGLETNSTAFYLKQVYNGYVYSNQKIPKEIIEYILNQWILVNGNYYDEVTNIFEREERRLENYTYWFIDNEHVKKNELDKSFLSNLIKTSYSLNPFSIICSAYMFAKELNYIPDAFYGYIPDELMKHLEEYVDLDITSEPLHPYEENTIYDLFKSFLLKS